MVLVALAQAAQDGDRLLDAGLVDEHRLEAALEGGVLLDVLAVLVERRRADGVQLAAGEHRLEQVGGVHRPFGRAGAHDGVQLVDEQDDLALGVLDLLQHRLQALFELAAVLGTGDQRTQVERHDALVLQALGHVAADDALGEALGDGRLAHARLADQHRVVLGPPREHLDDATDLLVAPDDRVELAIARVAGQVAAVLLQCLVGASGFWLVTRWPPRTSVSAARICSRPAPAASRMRCASPPASAAASSRCSVETYSSCSRRASCLGALEELARTRVETQRAALDLRPAGQDGAQLDQQLPGIRTNFAQGYGGHALGVLRQGGQHMLGVEDRALGFGGQPLGGEDRLLRLLRVAVEFHCLPKTINDAVNVPANDTHYLVDRARGCRTWIGLPDCSASCLTSSRLALVEPSAARRGPWRRGRLDPRPEARQALAGEPETCARSASRAECAAGRGRRACRPALPLRVVPRRG
jgi:hypothetical protein